MAQYPKESYIEQARIKLSKAGITFTEHNNSIHFKIGKVDFWPTTGKWIDGNDEGRGIQELIKHLTPTPGKIKKLSVEQMFDVAKKVYPSNLHEICKAIHKEIYGS